MKFSDLLSMSVNNLRRRKMRTFLTVLGVLIGTASLLLWYLWESVLMNLPWNSMLLMEV